MSNPLGPSPRPSVNGNIAGPNTGPRVTTVHSIMNPALPGPARPSPATVNPNRPNMINPPSNTPTNANGGASRPASAAGFNTTGHRSLAGSPAPPSPNSARGTVPASSNAATSVRSNSAADAFNATAALVRPGSQNSNHPPASSRSLSHGRGSVGGGMTRTSSFGDLRSSASANTSPPAFSGMNAPTRDRRQSETILRSINQSDTGRRGPGSFDAHAHPSHTAAYASSSHTVYDAPSSGNMMGAQGARAANLPQWGPPIYPLLAPVPVPSEGSISALYSRHAMPPAAPSVPFAPPPRPAQNIADDPDFFEKYKAVWTSFHPVHDGIERPAIQALLPPRPFWFGKRMLDIGCGSGKLCRQYRSSHASAVVGLDSSWRMIQAAEGRELAEQQDRVSGSSSQGGIGAALSKFFRSTLTEEQMQEKIARNRAKLQSRRDSMKLQEEETERENRRYAEQLAQATLEAEKEKERLAKELNQPSGSGSIEAGLSKEELAASKKENASFFKKLFKDSKDKLKPSNEAERYKAEADAKRAQREHEERVAAAVEKAQAQVRANAAAAAGNPPTAAASSTPTGHRLKTSASASSADDSSAFEKMKKVFSVDDDLFKREVSSASANGVSMDDSHTRGPFTPVSYIHSTFEEWDVSDKAESFHLVSCCMTMQFIFDLQAFARKVYSLLTPHGLFIASVDHPVSTAPWGVHPVVVKNDPRQPDLISYFPLDKYHDQGERKSKYYVEGVIKYHRRLDTYINTFLSAGFVLEKLVEPRASQEMEQKYPELKTWRRRPLFLCFRFRKPAQYDDF